MNCSSFQITNLLLLLLLLAMNPRDACDNYFYDGFIKFFFFFLQTNLIMSNVFHNYIFIYYWNNHKCNIETIQNTKKM